MRTVEVKKTRSDKPKAEKEKTDLPEGAESFSQTTKQTSKDKDITCFCCGKPGEYANECPLRKKIAEDDWFKNTGTKHYLKVKGKEVNAQVGSESTKSEKPSKETKRTKPEKKVGFVAQ